MVTDAKDNICSKVRGVAVIPFYTVIGGHSLGSHSIPLISVSPGVLDLLGLSRHSR